MARETAFLVRDLAGSGRPYDILGFVIDDDSSDDQSVAGYPLITDVSVLVDKYKGCEGAIAIGDPKAIRKFATHERILEADLTFPNIAHPSLICDSDRMRMGRGNIICAGNILTTDINIGSFNIINMACTIGHDVEIGDYCVINPGSNISGHVKINDGVLIGTGARILQSIEIGPGAVVGAGAVVTKDVPAGEVVVGIPAKPRRQDLVTIGDAVLDLDISPKS